MKRRIFATVVFTCLCGKTALTQNPQSIPESSPATPVQGGSPKLAQSKEGGGFLGKDIPSFDPGSEVMAWDGKIWNVQDQRVFRARFEKYLNSEEETGEDAKKYRDRMKTMLDLLSPAKASKENFRKAWAILPQASEYEPDAGLCNSLDDAIYGVLMAQREVTKIDDQNRTLAQRKDTLEWNSRFAADSGLLGPAPKNPAAAEQWNKEQALKRDMKMQPLLTELGEVNASIAGNRVKKEALRLQAKIEFQVLIAQLFLQRRFEHVLLANRFYRTLFGDGDSQLRVADDYAANQSDKNKESFGDISKLPKTIGQLDALANEAIRDVREGVEAFSFLLEKNELKSASERLSEAFVVGEYLPEIRLLPRTKKRQVIEFTQKSNQLLSSLEVKDYERAAALVRELESISRDFDSAKPMAAIETARTVSALHLAKARAAASSGDRTTLENELRSATEIWPRNPALAEVSGAIFSQTDVQQQALNDFDRLYAQKNFRQIYEDKVRFIAATALDRVKQEKLKQVLDQVQLAEAALLRAAELAKRGDSAGAWESVERGFSDYPDDPKLNQARAEFTTKAAEFVRSIRTAQEMERKQQWGSSLAWYLQAQEDYASSEIAQEGILRLSSKIMEP
ncbi:MAG: hypothetical protein EBT77_00035 [Verrucomicrobia bacterium]|nr:hypothetical protein [Verrucomicrobiota bacterium]